MSLQSVALRKSCRIRKNDMTRFDKIKTDLIYYMRMNRNTYTRDFTLSENKKKQREIVMCIYHVYSLVCPNFYLFLTVQPQINIERFFKICFDRIPEYLNDCVRFKLSARKIKPIFKRYIRIYRQYHYIKIHMMVLICRKFPADIVLLISRYYLSPTNFVA